MFPKNYFPSFYFPARYFPEAGGTSPTGGPIFPGQASGSDQGPGSDTLSGGYQSTLSGGMDQGTLGPR